MTKARAQCCSFAANGVGLVEAQTVAVRSRRPLAATMLAAIAVCAMTVTACGATSNPTSALSPTPPPASASPPVDPCRASLTATPAPKEFPIGTYTANLSASQVSTLTLQGTNTLQLNPDGTYVVSNAGEGAISGIFCVTGPQVTIHETGSSICGRLGSGLDHFGAGIYAWTASGNSLKFTLVHDTCDNGIRATQFTTSPWTKTG